MLHLDKIEKAVNQWVENSDCFLVEIKSSPGKVAIFIDKLEGVSLDDCTRLSRFLGENVEEAVWESFEREVSSPGMDQPFRVYQQYQRRVGREVRILTSEGREHRGTLKAADRDGVDLLETVTKKENKKKTVTQLQNHFTYDQIKETKLILSFKN